MSNAWNEYNNTFTEKVFEGILDLCNYWNNTFVFNNTANWVGSFSPMRTDSNIQFTMTTTIPSPDA